jgi:hypothetical protein
VTERLADGRAVDGDLALTAGAVSEGRTEADDRHDARL